MITRDFAPIRLQSWWDQTGDALNDLGIQPAPLDPSLAQATSGGRIRLCAERWLLGDTQPIAECRRVYIRGTSSEIINTLVFPRNPGMVPMFVADAMVIGGELRLAFVDLPTPGMEPYGARGIAERTFQIAARFPDRLERSQVPDWAVEFSGGGYLFLKNSPREQWEQLHAAWRDFLSLWVELARSPERDPGAADTTLLPFKQGHLARWPGREYLSKLFGSDWTDRFLTAFLYQ
jgi:hypothetical protein